MDLTSLLVVLIPLAIVLPAWWVMDGGLASLLPRDTAVNDGMLVTGLTLAAVAGADDACASDSSDTSSSSSDGC